jgi:hypothetical protein
MTEFKKMLERGEQFGVQAEARLRRTILWFVNPLAFLELLDRAVVSWQGKAKRRGLNLAIRLNGTSDIYWEGNGRTVMQKFYEGNENGYPYVTFYDYTKRPDRMLNFLESQGIDHYYPAGIRLPSKDPDSSWPDNYYLTYSMNEINFCYALLFLKMGGTATIAFDGSLGNEMITVPGREKRLRKDFLPSSFMGFQCIDGDLFDPRFLDPLYWRNEGYTDRPPPYIVALRVKGDEQGDTAEEIAEQGGFFFKAKDADKTSREPGYQRKMLQNSVQKLIFHHYGMAKYRKNKSPGAPIPERFHPYFEWYLPEYIDIIEQAFITREEEF